MRKASLPEEKSEGAGFQQRSTFTLKGYWNAGKPQLEANTLGGEVTGLWRTRRAEIRGRRGGLQWRDSDELANLEGDLRTQREEHKFSVWPWVVISFVMR